jgi:predicted  nucleic acid-binding Zn-ribbon protein
MWNGLDKLLDLQKLDSAIVRLEAEAQAIPQTIEGLEARLIDARAGLDAAKSKTDRIQKDRRVKERELEEVTQGTRKKQARLFEIKTNEEYSAVLKEIESLKGKSSKLEEEILELLEQADVATQALAEAEKVFKAAEAVRQRERAEKEAQLATIQQELAGLREARKTQASRLDGDLLRQYDRLRKSRGVAVVTVKEGSCSGCGIALTPQTYTEVRRNDQMYICPSCNRILYHSAG